MALAEVGIGPVVRAGKSNAVVWRTNDVVVRKATLLARLKVSGPDYAIKCDAHIRIGLPCGRVTVAEALLGRLCHLAART